MRAEKERKDQFASAVRNPSRARATLEKLFDILEDRTPAPYNRFQPHTMQGAAYYQNDGAQPNDRLDESQEFEEDDEFDDEQGGWESDVCVSIEGSVAFHPQFV
jgi:hypothetical protein